MNGWRPLRRAFEAVLFRALRLFPEQVERDAALWWGDRWRMRRDPWYRRERGDWQDFFRRAFMASLFNGIDGDYAEFGCSGANTFCLAYFESRRIGVDCRLWAFDSFQGLPPRRGREDSHPAWVEGTMRTDLERFHSILRKYRVPHSAYEVVPGFYEDTLAKPSPALPANIRLAYVDCDLYSSTVTVLRFLAPRLKHGMILAFDDYYCWSADQVSGERRACAEAFADHPEWQLVPFVQFGWHGMSFVVESRRLLGRATASW